jgi:hypothetical protein
MHDERMAVVEIGDQIFGAPAQGENAPPGEARREVFRKGKAQIASPLLDASDSCAGEHGFEAPPNRLDFGKFGHGRFNSSTRWEPPNDARRRAIKLLLS